MKNVNISKEEIISAIDALPVCVFYKDTNLRYQYVSKVWAQLNTDNAIGKTDLEIRKDYDNALIATERDKEIIKTKKGTQYVIFTEGEYLSIIKEPVLNDDGEVVGIAGSIVNVTDRIKMTQIDYLTKVLNRQGGTDAVTNSLENTETDNYYCLIDINKFKAINDTFGHTIGDRVLQESAQVFSNNATPEDIVMRLGGDEFVIFFVDKDESEVHQRIKKIFEDLKAIDVSKRGSNVKVTISVGIEKTKPTSTFDDLYIRADKKMYLAKSKKDDNYVF